MLDDNIEYLREKIFEKFLKLDLVKRMTEVF